MTLARSLPSLLALALLGCNNTAPAPDAGADLAMATDLATPPDLAPSIDLTPAIDLHPALDLVTAPDLVSLADLAPVPAPDLLPLADLAPPPDLAHPDLARVDFARPPDLTEPPADLARAPQTVDVTVAPNGALMFSPSTVTIHAGDTVRWTWASTGHTVTGGTPCNPDGTFCDTNDTNCSSAPTLTAGSTYSHTFPTAGTFPYFCRPHCFAGMTGSVVVQ